MSKNPILLRAGGALSVLALVGAAATWLKRRRSTSEPAGDSSSQPQLKEPAAGQPDTDPVARLQAVEDKAPSAAGEAAHRPDPASSATAAGSASTAAPEVRPGLIPNPADKPLARGPEGDLSSGAARPAPPAPEPSAAAAPTAPAEPPPPAPEPSGEPSGEAESAPGAEWHCQCGQPYRVTGEGRHRMFWLPDAAPADPVLDDRCPNCGRELSLQA